jgi:hypothetical protein
MNALLHYVAYIILLSVRVPLFKKYYFFTAIFFTHLVHGQEYSLNAINIGTIHTTTVTSSWCGNLALSTILGKTENGKCIYIKETPSAGLDTCGPFQLNAFFLEKNGGLGFNCAATHVHSHVTGYDGVDEYLLILDNDGHYIDTKNSRGHIILN